MNSNFVRAAAIACVLGLAGCATSGAPQSEASKTAAAKPARTAEQIMMNELIDNPSAHAILKKHADSRRSSAALNGARHDTRGCRWIRGSWDDRADRSSHCR